MDGKMPTHSSIYKCCLKPLPHFICTNCLNVYHKCCISKTSSKKSYKFLGDNKIICCSVNSNKTLDEVTADITVLEKTISELGEESETKDKYIQKLKHQYSNFMEEAERNETELYAQIDRQKNLIEELRNTINKLQRKKLTLDENSCSASTQVNLSNSTEHKSCMTDGPSKSRDITHHVCYHEKGSQTYKSRGNKLESIRTNPPSRSQCLILSPNYHCSLGFMLKKNSSTKFNINCQDRRQNTFSEIIKHHLVLSKNFNKQDYKIVYLGSGDAFQGKMPSESDMKDLVSNSEHTNLIIVGIPTLTMRPILRKFIDMENELFTNYCQKYKWVNFIDPNNILKPFHIYENGKLKYSGLQQIIQYISDEFIDKKCCSKTQPSTSNVSLSAETTEFVQEQNPKTSFLAGTMKNLNAL